MKKWTNEQIDYLKKIYKSRTNSEIAYLMNKRFNTNFTKAAISSKKTKLKLKSEPKMKTIYTEKIIDFILQNYKGRDNVELAEMINKKFNIKTNGDKISMFKANYKRRYGVDLRTGINKGCFKKGHIPINKGTKGMFNVGGNKTSFKKGHIPKNHKPVGFERINVNGYVEIKVKEPNVFKLKHRVLYEKEYGEIPKGYKIIFADGNKKNLNLNNLIMVSSNEELIMNRNSLFYDNDELTKTGVNIARLMDKTCKLKNERL